MLSTDVEVVRRSFHAWNAADPDALQELHDEDAVFHSALTELVGTPCWTAELTTIAAGEEYGAAFEIRVA